MHMGKGDASRRRSRQRTTMQALTDPLFAASQAPASAASAPTVRGESPRTSAKPRSERVDGADTALQAQVRAALNDLAEDMFRSIQAHEEQRRRPARPAASQEQADHLRAALAAAQHVDVVDVGAGGDQEPADTDADPRFASRPFTEDSPADDEIRRVEEQRDLLTRVLRQVTERCESSERDVRQLQTALRQADEQRAHDTARIEQLTSECSALSASYEWTRTRLDDVENAASQSAAEQSRELDAAHAANRALTTALERHAQHSTALEAELASARVRLSRQAEQLVATGAAYDGLQQLLTRMVNGVSEAGARLQHLIEHQKSRVEHIESEPAASPSRTTDAE